MSGVDTGVHWLCFDLQDGLVVPRDGGAPLAAPERWPDEVELLPPEGPTGVQVPYRRLVDLELGETTLAPPAGLGWPSLLRAATQEELLWATPPE
jgi:hypothetical protein